MVYGSVCSGIEAATVAWHALGWRAAWFSEIEPFPCAVLAHHHPDVPNLGDMTRLHESAIFNERSIDLLVGGTPCQSFSVAGLRKGLADPRGNLALVFLALADRARPRWVVWENVPGVLSSNGGRDFGAFIGGLGELGYGWAYRVLDAQYFGVPQRRRRVFVVGCLGDWRPAAAVLFERASLSGNPPPGRKTRKGTAAGFETGPQGGSFTDLAPTLDARCKDGLIRNQLGAGVFASETGHGFWSEREHTLRATNSTSKPQTIIGVDDIAGCLQERDAKGPDSDTKPGHLIPIQAVIYENHGQDSRVKECAVSPQINAKAGTGGGNLPLIIDMQASKGNANVGKDGICPTLSKMHGHDMHAVAWSEELNASENVAGTVQRGGDGGRHDGAMTPLMQVRRLTPRECERLQGFPDDYTLIPYRGGVRCGWPAIQSPRQQHGRAGHAVDCSTHRHGGGGDAWKARLSAASATR